MMATTHATMGVLLATPLFWVAPEFAVPAALAAMAGGVFPDLDLGVLEHRKTLHYPEHYWPLAAAAFGIAVGAPSTLTVAAAFFVLSAAVHSVTDAFGGGLGARPWANDDQRGVYSHTRRRWIRPRRWIRYDGAPEDLLAVVVLSIPGLALYDGLVRRLTVAMLAVSVVYTFARKRLPDLLD
ncbi:metal-dependent hydrolase [Halobacterium sp. KA-6]|uniref:metal-dependent hydrolase n=1 Tax=Halobacterium sp. KA-6 TaxID=2896368 RepID=UPI003FA5E9FB